MILSPELIPGAAPLSSVRGLSASQIRMLNDLWIDSAAQLIGIYGTTEPIRLRLAAALGIGRTGLDGIVSLAQRLERAGQFGEVALRPGQTIVGPIAWQPPHSGRVHLAVRLM